MEAARAAGVSRWASELRPLFLGQQLLEHLVWQSAVCGVLQSRRDVHCPAATALDGGDEGQHSRA